MTEKKWETTDKKGRTTEWTWDETPETTAAIKQLHEGIRLRKLKEQDDALGYDTGGK